MTDFLSGFTRDPSWKPIDCPCGWRGRRGDLRPSGSVEHYHPANRQRVVGDLRLTRAESCPNCGRWHWADGQPVRAPA